MGLLFKIAMKKKEIRKQLALQLAEIVYKELAAQNQTAADKIQTTIQEAVDKIAKKFVKHSKKEEKKLFKKENSAEKKTKSSDKIKNAENQEE